ncbi:MAG: zinc-ribbon domain-containing protein, partial [Pseudobutyrivibrio sp.]|nr:zinc-ribbon domain-containing protein [Pseudobutyrivibrio sp.]
MFCENCGTKLEDGTLFCTNCGAKQEVPEVAPEFTPEAPAASEAVTEVAQEVTSEAAPQPAVAPQPVVAPQPTVAPQPQVVAPKKPSIFKRIPTWGYIVGSIVLIALIVGGVILFKFVNEKRHTVNVADYLTVEFDGYDTVGTATVELDEEFWDVVYEKASFKDKSRYEKEDYFTSYFTEAEYMESEIGPWFSYEIDKSSKLKNGDEVKVEYKVKAEKIKKKYGVIIKAETQKFTVEGLEECDTFDPFEDIEIKYSGVSEYGEAEYEIVNDRDVYDDISFSFDNDYYLEEGDEITLTFGPYYDEDELLEYCAENYGCIPTATEKTYTVEGLGSYVTDANDLNDSNLSDMIEKAKKYVETIVTDFEEGQLYEGSFVSIKEFGA